MSFRGGEDSAERLAKLLIQWCNETKRDSFEVAFCKVLMNLRNLKGDLQVHPLVYSSLFGFINSRRSENPYTELAYYTSLAALIEDPYSLDE